MSFKAVSIFVAAIVVTVALCAGAGMISHHDSHLAKKSMECCSMLSAGFVMEPADSASVFYAAALFLFVFSLFVPAKIAIPLFHPPKQ